MGVVTKCGIIYIMSKDSYNDTELVKQIQSLQMSVSELHNKVGSIEKKMDLRELEMKPMYEAYSSAKNTGEFIIWVSKIIIAFGVIVGLIIGATKFWK